MKAVVSWNWDQIYSHPLNIEKRSTTPRWETPCSRDTSDSLPPMVIPVEQALRAMSVKSTLQKDSAIVLKKNYIPVLGRRLTNSFLITNLETADMEGLNLVEESDNMQTACKNNNISTILLNEYRLLSTLAVFLEKVLEDEVYFEHSELYDLMAPVQDKLYELMCDLHTTLYTILHVTIENHVTRDVMNTDLRSLSEDRSSRYYRDYVIYSKNIQYLNHLSAKFLNLTTSL